MKVQSPQTDALNHEVGRRIEAEAQLAVEIRKRAEHDEMFRLFAASVRDYALFMLDPDGNVATWNIGAEHIKGYRADEIIGRHFSMFYPATDVRAGKCALELKLARRDGRFEDEGWRVRKDGSQFWANVVISTIYDEAGRLLGFSKITRDLTERRRAEAETAARLAAEQANRTKDEFLAMLSHELRNPLAPIVTALQLIKARRDTRSAKEEQIIERQVNHLLRLVDDLLDVSRISKGKLELKKQRVDIRVAIRKAIEITSPLVDQRGHHLASELPAKGVVVEADETRLTQIFTNLITNAAKYTDPGGHIRVGVHIASRELVAEIADDGIGLEPELLPRVFDLFVQGDQTTERGVGGLGLGLTLVRRLVELHGGSVAVTSQGIGTGSTFTVRLPLAHIQEIDVMPASPSSLFHATTTPRRILIVDDNEDARILLADILTTIGHHVESVGDAAEALDVAKRFQPEIAILDIGLPVMDGYELAPRMRAVLTDDKARLIALTGYGRQDDRERSAKAGFDIHLVKPVDVQKLLTSISAGQ